MSMSWRRQISGTGLQGHRPRPAVRRREAPSLALSDADQPGERRAAGRMRAADERGGTRNPRGSRRHPPDHRPRPPRLYRRARGFLLPCRSRADPPLGRRGRRQAAHRAQPQRHRPHRVQAGAEGPAGGAAHRACRDDRGLAGGGRARARHHRRRLYARTAGAAHDLRPLSCRVHRAVAARYGPSASRRAYRRSLQHGCGGDHDLGLRARPHAHGGAARLRASAGEFLRLHRRRRLRHRRLRRAQARCSSTPGGSCRTSMPGPDSRSDTCTCPTRSSR